MLHLAYEKGEGEGNFEQLEELFVFLKPFHLFWIMTASCRHTCFRQEANGSGLRRPDMNVIVEGYDGFFDQRVIAAQIRQWIASSNNLRLS